MSVPIAHRIFEVSEEYFPTVAGGPRACGMTLEQAVFGKAEDNKAEADVLGHEIKAVTRLKHTLSKRVRAFTNASGQEQSLITEFGTLRKDGKTRFCTTVRNGGRSKVGGISPRIERDSNNVYMLTGERQIAAWTMDSFQPIFENKLSKLAIVSTRKKANQGIQLFNYYHADIYAGFNQDNFWTMVDDGRVTIEFRLGGVRDGDKFTDMHDHGTCFNVTTRNLPFLYKDHYSTDLHALHLESCIGPVVCPHCSS